MQYSLVNAAENTAGQLQGFNGLNRMEKGERNEFSDMLNMSSDRYPCLAPAKAIKKALSEDDIPKEEIRAVIAPRYRDGEITKFTGVAGSAFYYEGEKKKYSPKKTEDGENNDDDGEDDKKSAYIPDGNVCLVDFNGRIIICVYDENDDEDDEGTKSEKKTMLYYDYTASGTDEVLPMEKGIRDDNDLSFGVYSSGDPEEDIKVTNYITCSGVDWENDYGFKEGDSVFIEGFGVEENNTVFLDSRYRTVSVDRAISCIVEKVKGNRLYVQLYNRDGNRLVFQKNSNNKFETNVKGVKVYTKIPTMNHICIHNNRLWGTNPNGEYVYASKLGDCFNFNTFMGLNNDSFYAEIGTPGGFEGIVSYRDNLVAFKKDYIHHIYGDKPSNFTIPKQLSDCGCTDIRSAVQIGSALYFLGYGGFYTYSGGQPQLISEKLDRKYTSAVAATDGRKYIVSAKSDDGDEFLVYDTKYDIWHKEKFIDVIGSFRWHDKVYLATDNNVFEYGALTPGEWECESVVIHEDIFDNKGINEIWIRAKIDEDAHIDVFTSEDGGEFLHRKRLKHSGLKVYHLPVRFITGEFYQYRLKGYGNAVIYDIEYKNSMGGREYRM